MKLFNLYWKDINYGLTVVYTSNWRLLPTFKRTKDRKCLVSVMLEVLMLQISLRVKK